SSHYVVCWFGSGEHYAGGSAYCTRNERSIAVYRSCFEQKYTTIIRNAMVKQFLMNLLLSFIWVALTGVLYYTNFLFGFAIGFFLMWLMNRNESDQRYFTRVPKIIGFFLYFLYEMIKANIQ